MNKGASAHERAFELLPWLVNGRLSEKERDCVERHVRECLRCRAELKAQQTLRSLVREHPTVHLSAEQGFQKLRRQMEVPHVTPSADGAIPMRRQPQGSTAERQWRLSPAFAAAAAVAAVVAGAGAWLVSGSQDPGTPAYRVLTDGAQSEAHLDIIFADGASEAQMRALLEDVDATIVAGPSRLGRYSVRLRAPEVTGAETDALVRRLLADPRVRFAGPTRAPAQAMEPKPEPEPER